MKGYFLFLFILILPFPAIAEITFSQLARISTTPEILEGRFNQEKYLSALDTVLISTGVFNYQRSNSIRWEILEPIQYQMLLTPTVITNKQGDRELSRFDVGSNPVAAVLGEVFFSVLTAEWENLSEYFELSGKIDGQQWHAILLPLDQAVIQIFSRVELKGEVLLEEIILYENGGDRTTIRLDNQRG